MKTKRGIAERLKCSIRDVPDFPKKGIIFKDITTLLKEEKAFREAVDILAKRYRNKKIDRVVVIESRGFIIGAPIAYKLRAGVVPIRKKGKLPAKTVQQTYSLEYGLDTLEIHADAIKPGMNVLVIDDLLATGGTARATVNLIRKLQGKIIGICFLIELTFLNGRKKLKGYEVFSLIKF